jgi:hypothetical protein
MLKKVLIILSFISSLAVFSFCYIATSVVLKILKFDQIAGVKEAHLSSTLSLTLAAVFGVTTYIALYLIINKKRNSNGR